MNKAIEAYSRSIELYPHNPATYNNRGVAYYIKGDYERVIIDYTKVIELKPDDAKAYYNRGKIYQEKGDIDLAIADFNTVEYNSNPIIPKRMSIVVLLAMIKVSMISPLKTIPKQ